jgi:hypothetical protein
VVLIVRTRGRQDNGDNGVLAVATYKSQRPPRGPLFDAKVRTIDVMLKLVKLLVN